MRLVRGACYALTLLAGVFGSAAHADIAGDFLAARQAVSSGDGARFARYAEHIPPTYSLYPYLAYWRLGSAASDGQTSDFLATYPNTWLAERVRANWLKRLGQRDMWPAYLAEFPRLVYPDTAHQCYERRAELAAGIQTHLKDAIALWFNGRDLPSACDPLFAQLIQQGLINHEDLWRRLRLALEADNVRVALAITRYLPADEQAAPALIELAQRTPVRVLDASSLQLYRRQDREWALYALNRLAQQDTQQAESALRPLLPLLPAADQRYAWGLLATQAARRHDVQALSWFARAGELVVSDTQREWWARAALRAGQWPQVAAAIDSMDEPTRSKSAWRYWRARAWQAQSQPQRAATLLAPLSREPEYYGQLALEELGTTLGNAPINVKVGGIEIDAVARDPGIARALAFDALGLRNEATGEWNWAIRNFDDRQLLAAAELARRANWYDRAINTAERTRETHDFDLRFIAPYRDLAASAAADNHLNEAWVYGLIRQESRFVNVARSGVGASGLMQIMPATARWIARRLGLKRFDPDDMQTPETNLRFGTFYLSHIQAQLDGSAVLATAAYNAGPTRAQRWRTSTPMEAAIYIETIPFAETRDYVRKVMSNAMYYAARFGQQSALLKDRLGLIPGRVVAVPDTPVDTLTPTLEPDATGG
jgi:soluble lytic murein transglycosylase